MSYWATEDIFARNMHEMRFPGPLAHVCWKDDFQPHVRRGVAHMYGANANPRSPVTRMLVYFSRVFAWH